MVITPITCSENGEDDSALEKGNDDDDYYHDRNPGGVERVAEMEKMRKEAEKRYTKSEYETRKNNQSRANRTSGRRKTRRKNRQFIEVRESK